MRVFEMGNEIAYLSRVIERLIPEIHTVPETAKILRCSYNTVLARIADGSLESVKRGRRVMITRQAIDKYLSLK